MKPISLLVCVCLAMLSLGCAKQDTRRALCDTLAEITRVPISATERELVERDLKEGLLGREFSSTYSTLAKRVEGGPCLVWEPQPLMDGRIAFPLYVRVRTKGGDPELLVIFYADGGGKIADVDCRDSVQFREGY